MKKTSADNLIAGDLFVPGTYIAEEMEARGMKQVELAAELGLSKSEMSLIIHGKRSITIPIAIKLERLFKIDAEIWMNIQIKYEIEKLKQEYSKELKDKSIPAGKKKKIKKAISLA